MTTLFFPQYLPLSTPQVEDVGRKQAVVLTTEFDSDKADKQERANAVEAKLDRQQEAIDVLAETLKEERENRLQLAEFTKKELEANSNRDIKVDKKAEGGVVPVQNFFFGGGGGGGSES